jgi:hypothetical protein
MLSKNPDKFIRKALFDALFIKGYNVTDTRILAPTSLYILLSTQSKQRVIGNKCAGHWNCNIDLEIIDRVPVAGSGGSRAKINDAETDCIEIFNTFTIDGFKIVTRDYNSTSVPLETPSANINRIILTINITAYEHNFN